MTFRTFTRTPAFPAAILALVSVGLYLPSLGGEFAYDSRGQILVNDYVHQPRHLRDVLTLSIMREDVLDNDRPLAVLTFLVDALWSGRNPAGFHLTNILLHAAAVAALFLFCRRLLPSFAAFGAALLFAVHPLACEAVAEVSNRKDILAALMIFVGLWLAAEFRPGRILTGCACVLCFFLAVAAKESGAAGPAVLLLYWWIYRRREPRRDWIILMAAAWIAVCAFMVAVFLLWPVVSGGQSVIFHDRPSPLAGTLGATLLVQVRIWAFEIRQVFWPLRLCADYTPFALRNFLLAWSGAALAAFLALQGALSRWDRAAVLGAGLFWCGLLPASNIIPLFCPIADRFLYLPMGGLALSAAVAAARFRRHAAAAVAACVLLSMPLASATLQRERVWHDAFSLWSDALGKDPTSFRAVMGLASAQMHRGEPANALGLFQRAEKMVNGRVGDTLAGQALAYEAMGNPFAADLYFAETVSRDARFADPAMIRRAMMLEPDELQVWLRIMGRNAGPR